MVTIVPQAPVPAALTPPTTPARATPRRSREPLVAAVAASGLAAAQLAGVAPKVVLPIAFVLPIAATLFGPAFHVDPVRRGAWLALVGVTALAAGAEPSPRDAALSCAVLVLAALWLSLRAYRDPRWQIRQALRALARGDLDTAHLAYGRYLRLGRDPGEAFWRGMRAREIRDVDVVRPRFGGMVNAIRYGERGAMGDRAFAALFPEVGASRASAEEG